MNYSVSYRLQESVAEITRLHKVHANVVYKWKRQLAENVVRAFEPEGTVNGMLEREDELLKKIGELTVERDCLAHGLDRLR